MAEGEAGGNGTRRRRRFCLGAGPGRFLQEAAAGNCALRIGLEPTPANSDVVGRNRGSCEQEGVVAELSASQVKPGVVWTAGSSNSKTSSSSSSTVPATAGVTETGDEFVGVPGCF